MKKATKAKAKKNSKKQEQVPGEVDTVDEEDVYAAIFAQDIAVETEKASRTINDGIAEKLRKGAAMVPGYEFDWDRRAVKKAG